MLYRKGLIIAEYMWLGGWDQKVGYIEARGEGICEEECWR